MHNAVLCVLRVKIEHIICMLLALFPHGWPMLCGQGQAMVMVPSCETLLILCHFAPLWSNGLAAFSLPGETLHYRLLDMSWPTTTVTDHNMSPSDAHHSVHLEERSGLKCKLVCSCLKPSLSSWQSDWHTQVEDEALNCLAGRAISHHARPCLLDSLKCKLVCSMASSQVQTDVQLLLQTLSLTV